MMMVRHKMLVVDDELFVRELLEEYFSKLDFEVVAADSGPAALRMVAENRFNVALIDLKMSDMDGIEVVKRIRELDRELILILMTGYPTVESSVEAMRAGAYDYVIKPFRLSELKDIITGAVKEYQVRCEIGQIKSRLSLLEGKLAAATGESGVTGLGGGTGQDASSSSEPNHSGFQSEPGLDLNVECQLERWGKLLKEGLITQQEFEASKNRILGNI